MAAISYALAWLLFFQRLCVTNRQPAVLNLARGGVLNCENVTPESVGATTTTSDR